MKDLRRKDRAIMDDEAIAILNKGEYGVLSTVSPDGKPYGVPLNFFIMGNCIYFHCAIEDQKIDNIEITDLYPFESLEIPKFCQINLEPNMRV